MNAARDRSALVVGAGLLGTSIGLALTAVGWVVHLADADPRAERLAADLRAGERGLPEEPPDVVVIAVPPALVARVGEEYFRLFPQSTFTDVASVKTQVQVEIDTYTGLASHFVGGHPLAGRERSGPDAARADLFEGRPWVLTPVVGVDAHHVRMVEDLVRAVGGVVVRQTPEEHDAAVAVVSHVPQVAASLVAARLLDAPPDALGLAGPGLLDTTRIAGSDPELWTQILLANAEPVDAVLERLAADLDAVRAALARVSGTSSVVTSTDRPVDEAEGSVAAADALREALDAGCRGRQRIPGKHGGRAVTYAMVPVVVPDEPGALARLFVAAGEAGVNIEDVAIEHSPGQPVGLVELAVAPDRVDALARALTAGGWLVH